MNPCEKHRIFLSVAGTPGKEAAHQLLHQWECQGLGSNEDFWFYDIHSAQGADIRSEYLRRLRNSHFYVPVLTKSFCSSVSAYVKEEIATAVQIQEEIHRKGANYNFIVPYLADTAIRQNELPDELKNLVHAGASQTVKTLKFAMESNLGLSTFRAHRRPLGNWPSIVFDDEKIPNVMFVLGHTDKEGELIPEQVDSFRRWGLIDGDLEWGKTLQSLRPAQMVPHLQRFLYEHYLEDRTITSGRLPLMPCEIDRHLINYRSDLLGRYNLLVMGAGDTNWITRAILRHYKDALLSIRFNDPTSSQEIVIDTRDHGFGGGYRLTLGQIGDEESSPVRSIRQVLPNDAQYSAIIFSVPNPWNIAKTAIICAGLTGLGTQAAAFALTDPDFHCRLKSKFSASAIVIRGKEQNWLPIGYDIVF